MKTLRERFDTKWIPEPFSGCWLWTAGVDWAGYGKIGLGRRRGSTGVASRVSWQLYRGEIPERMCVLHKCDTPICVNPDHLFLGNNADNSRDMTSKKRQTKGTDQHLAKLTEEQVLEIRSSNNSQRELARQYGVTQAAIWYVKNQKTWKHLPQNKTKKKGK